MTIFYNIYKYRICTVARDIYEVDNINVNIDKMSTVYFSNIEMDPNRFYIGDERKKRKGATLFFNKLLFPEREIVPDTIQGRMYLNRYMKKGYPIFYHKEDIILYDSILYDVATVINKSKILYSVYNVDFYDEDSVDYESWLFNIMKNICKDLNINFSILNRNLDANKIAICNICMSTANSIIKRYCGDKVNEKISLTMSKRNRKENNDA